MVSPEGTDACRLRPIARPNTPSPMTELEALMVDRATASLLVAWRRSVADLEAASAVAEARGDDVTWFDVTVSISNDEQQGR
jgi:hypothetical protein